MSVEISAVVVLAALAGISLAVDDTTAPTGSGPLGWATRSRTTPVTRANRVVPAGERRCTTSTDRKLDAVAST
ncbi:MAG TPA: hypothetical protein VK585_14175 [Jiangellaceae bacterium]|nr:hypothetical protein [Jiangellaceae bacterium]